MGRVIKTIKNAKINLFYYVCFMFVSFFSRKMFLEYLGANFVGLTGTLNGVLGMLNIAELGVGTAVGYALYKPIYDKDNDEVNKIISLLGYIYKKIGLLILFFGIAISLVIPLILQNTPFNYWVIFLAFLSFLFSSFSLQLDVAVLPMSPQIPALLPVIHGSSLLFQFFKYFELFFYS